MTYGHRKRLPVTRNGLTHKLELAGTDGQMHDVYIIVGFFEDGCPGELFITTGKMGSTMRGMLDTIGIQTSLLMQYGVPLRVICEKLGRIAFEPSGKTNNAAPELSECSSIIDYIFRWLAHTFEEYLDPREEQA